MRKLAIATLFMSVFVVQSAFAQNLGQLSGDKIPQKLVSVADFQNFLKNPQVNQTQENQERNARNQNDLWGWGSLYGYGYGSYYPYLSYFPYYYGSYYYPYYGYGYGYGWWADEGNDQNRTQGRSMPADAAHSPVVCFANDNTGNWFGSADLAMNVANAQDAANRECSASGGNCHLSLGCAVAYGDSNSSR